MSAAVVLTLLVIDGDGLSRGQRILVAVATCIVGVSFGLPLYLLLRERQRPPATPSSR